MPSVAAPTLVLQLVRLTAPPPSFGWAEGAFDGDYHIGLNIRRPLEDEEERGDQNCHFRKEGGSALLVDLDEFRTHLQLEDYNVNKPYLIHLDKFIHIDKCRQHLHVILKYLRKS